MQHRSFMNLCKTLDLCSAASFSLSDDIVILKRNRCFEGKKDGGDFFLEKNHFPNKTAVRHLVGELSETDR